MSEAIIIIGSGALNIIEENELYKQLNRPIYVLLSHQNEALKKRAQQVMGQGGILFIVDLHQPFRKLTKKQNEQLVALYEEELTSILRKHDSFLVVGGASGLFSSAVLQYVLKLLNQQHKKMKLITWLASAFEGKKFDNQIEQLQQLIQRLHIEATVIEPSEIAQPLLSHLAHLNKEIADKIIEKCIEKA